MTSVDEQRPEQEDPESTGTEDSAVPESAVRPDVTSGEYVRGYLDRLRAGDTGLLPVVVGMILIAIVFQVASHGDFLTPGNLVGLLQQGAFYMTLAMAAVFVLLLGEVDLSLGYVAGVGGVVTAVFVSDQGWVWPAACLAGLVATTLIGLLQGAIIAFLGVPSFVVTLAGFLGWNGVILLILGNGATIPIQNNVIFNFDNGLLSPLVGWIVYVAFAVVYVGAELFKIRTRRAKSLAQQPAAITIGRVVVVLLAGLVVILICNANRGRSLPIRGMPWVVLIVLGVLLAATWLTTRTRFGRYIYAVGGNAEAARRAGINLAGVRIAVFGLAGLVAGIGGLLYISRLASMSTAYDGGTYVLYAIAAAVIGGTSLFGGRGKLIHGVLGGLVIAGIDNGMGLLSMSAAQKYVVTALVLLVAVSLDAVARRGRQGHGIDA
ncbi:MAG TPA: ABC transporter permease [Nocardioidaceae bacterium]|nr:ABC transporter permease [Nocardioidaceae bacterium]